MYLKENNEKAIKVQIRWELVHLTKLISTPKTNLDKTRVILKICILDTDFMYCPNLSSAQTEFIQN